MRGRYLCWISCLLLIGTALFGRGGPVSPPVAEGRQIRVLGTVYRQEFKGTTQRLYLKNISLYSNAAQSLPQTEERYKKRVIVYLKDEEKVQIGNRLLADGVCHYPESARNPGGFDQKAYYQGMGVGMLLYKGSILRKDSSVYPVRDLLSRFQLACRKQFMRIGEEEDAGILSAMLLGDRGILEEETRDLYQDAGIIHLLAVSGLHVSLTGMALFHLLRKLRMSYLFSGAASGLVMAAYACMTGSVSAVRAVLMFLIFLLAQTTGRTYDLPTALAVAGAAIVTVRETQLTQAGFLLSFGAVCGVLTASLWQSRPLRGTALGISLGVQLFTLPLTVFFYYQFPLYALVINFCVLWMMPFVLGFGMAGLAASVVSLQLGRFLLAPAHYLLEAAGWLCEKSRLLPFSAVVTGKPALWKIAAYYAALAALAFGIAGLRNTGGLLNERLRSAGGLRNERLRNAGGPQNARLRNARLRSAGSLQNARLQGWRRDLALLLPLLGMLAGVLAGNRDGSFRMTFLDVGQGDGCCIQNEKNSVWLVDGGSSSENDLARYCLEPFLKSRGIDRVDYWLISHGDTDHVSGLLEILRAYVRRPDGTNAAGITVGCILLPVTEMQEDESDVRQDTAQSKGADSGGKARKKAEADGAEEDVIAEITRLAREHEIEVRYVQKGTVVRDGAMTVRILSPQEGIVYEDINAASVVARAEYGGFSALFTGDVQGAGEDMLWQNGLLADIDVLKAAHHGSRNSTSEEFLAAVRPEFTVISCGEDNSYGHPHEELLQRLAACGSAVARTDMQGAVEVSVAGNGYRVTTMR